MKKRNFVFILSILCALCSCKKEYLITINPNNGDEVISKKYNKGELINVNLSPQKKNCNFLGWFDENGNKIDFSTYEVVSNNKIIAKYEFTDKIFENEINPETKKEGANIRVSSFNVLASDYNNRPKVTGYNERNELEEGKGRDIGLWNYLNEYKPDVVGVQEFCNEFYESLDNQTLNGFDYTAINLSRSDRYICGGVNDGAINYSTILYNTKTIELIEWNQMSMERNIDDKNMQCRNLSWARFKELSTNKEFIVTSCHFALPNNVSGRELHAQFLAKQVKELESKYNLPIISTGDFNTCESDSVYNKIKEETGFKSAKFDSKTKGLVIKTGHIGLEGDYTEEDKEYWYRGIDTIYPSYANDIESIDHIFTSKELLLIYYDTVINENVCNISDHLPIFCDIAL